MDVACPRTGHARQIDFVDPALEILDRVGRAVLRENEVIGAITANEQVVSKTAGQGVVAIFAAKDVIASSADEDVAGITAVRVRDVRSVNEVRFHCRPLAERVHAYSAAETRPRTVRR